MSGELLGLLILTFVMGIMGGALALYVWQQVTLRRAVDRLLQDLPEQ